MLFRSVAPVVFRTFPFSEAAAAHQLLESSEHVGKIVDFMLDTERGSVEYAVLAVGGVLGVGAKMLAVEPNALRFDAGRRCLEITVDTATLAAHPGIDRANPPDSANAAVRSGASSPQPTTRSER